MTVSVCSEDVVAEAAEMVVNWAPSWALAFWNCSQHCSSC